MQLPKKITPDSIINAVVEVKYESKVPFELLIGLLFPVFDDSYTYTAKPLKNPSALIINPMQELAMNLGGQSLLYNDKISIRLLPSAFVFSCLGKYIGWDLFRAEIEKVLKIIGNTGYVIKWNRLGLRYITEYLKTDLKDCTKFSFTFGFPEVQSLSTTFHNEFEYKGAKVIMNLNNKIPTVRQQEINKTLEVVPSSIIDVDVIKDPLSLEKVEEIMDVMEEVHTYEKEVFFTLLTEDFLKTLHPEY
jgi:uncharacterized protein (TIGR04255 family)